MENKYVEEESLGFLESVKGGVLVLFMLASIVFFLIGLTALGMVIFRGKDYDLASFLSLAIPVVFFVLYSRRKNKKFKKTRQERESSFEKKKHAIHLLDGSSEGVVLNNPFRGIFILGGAGSGKSESIAVPTMLNFIAKGYCGLIYDFKFPSLANDAQKFINEYNPTMQHCFLNFGNPQQSHRVNPFNPKYLPNVQYAREYATSLITNLMPESAQKKDYWIRSATNILAAVIWFLREEHPQYSTLPHVLAMVTADAEPLLETLQTNIETAQMTQDPYDAMKRGSANQLSGTLGTLQSITSQINTPDLMYVFSADEFSLDLNKPDNPTVLTVGNNPSLQESISPLCSLIVTVCTKMMNEPNKQRSFVLLDELPTIHIPRLEVLPNTGRENEVSTVLMVQDYSQLKQSYGQDTAEVLFSACNNHFYGRVSSSSTGDMLSKQFGKYDKVFHSQSSSYSSNSKGGSHSSSQGQSIQQREVIKGSDFLELPTGQFVSSLVESNKTGYYKGFYRMTDVYLGKSRNKKENALQFPSHSRENIKAFYIKVREEITSILTQEESPKTAQKTGLKQEFEPQKQEQEFKF